MRLKKSDAYNFVSFVFLMKICDIINVSSITAFWQLLTENLQNRFSDVV